MGLAESDRKTFALTIEPPIALQSFSHTVKLTNCMKLHPNHAQYSHELKCSWYFNFIVFQMKTSASIFSPGSWIRKFKTCVQQLLNFTFSCVFETIKNRHEKGISLSPRPQYSLRCELHAICAKMKWIIDNNMHLEIHTNATKMAFAPSVFAKQQLFLILINHRRRQVCK